MSGTARSWVTCRTLPKVGETRDTVSAGHIAPCALLQASPVHRLMSLAPLRLAPPFSQVASTHTKNTYWHIHSPQNCVILHAGECGCIAVLHTPSGWWNSCSKSFAARYRSVANAAIHPEPAAVIACLHSVSCRSPAEKTPSTLVCTLWVTCNA